MVDYSWLHDLVVLEDAPSHGVDIIAVYVLDLLSASIDGLERDPLVLFKVSNEGLKQLRWEEKLEVGLLVAEATFRTPAEDRVVGLHPVTSGLRVDGQEPI